MNEYIEKLKKQKKIDLVTDKSSNFNWQLGDKTVGKDFVVIAGPCSVESQKMITDMSVYLKKLGVDAIRGGAYKPCTYPVKKEKNGWKEGLGAKGLLYLMNAGHESTLPVVTEAMDKTLLPFIVEHADVIQVGTRNFQNYALLDALGKLDTPILLKRGTWGTLDEILGACERIAAGGNNKIAICLRGVVGMPSYRHIFKSTRWAPDIMMIPALKQFTNIPIIYDPSHSTGNRDLVESVSKAAIAAGADGLIIECHETPEESISDPDQAITTETLSKILKFKDIYFESFSNH